MREIFKAQMEEFHRRAFDCYAPYCDGDGGGPVPMDGDKFFVLEVSEGDEFYEWNSNGWWQNLSDEDVPDELFAKVH